jgi:GNAT superfamily N-acetyltransferase
MIDLEVYSKRLFDLSQDEISALTDLTLDCNSFMSSSLKRLKERPEILEDSSVMVARYEDRIVAWCLSAPWFVELLYGKFYTLAEIPKDHQDLNSTFVNVYVHHDLRDQHVGSFLLKKFFLEVAQCHDSVFVNGWNKGAKYFYKKLGFKRFRGPYMFMKFVTVKQ